MKTITEFSGFTLAEALKKKFELTPKPERPQHGGKKKQASLSQQ